MTSVSRRELLATGFALPLVLVDQSRSQLNPYVLVGSVLAVTTDRRTITILDVSDKEVTLLCTEDTKFFRDEPSIIEDVEVGDRIAVFGMPLDVGTFAAEVVQPVYEAVTFAIQGEIPVDGFSVQTELGDVFVPPEAKISGSLPRSDLGNSNVHANVRYEPRLDAYVVALFGPAGHTHARH